MATVVDTSLVVAAMRPRDVNHAAARRWLGSAGEDLVTSPLVVTELDYFAGSLGAAHTAALWHDLDAGAYHVRWWADALRETLVVARRWADLRIGLADASLIAVAHRLNTRRIATFDERHFRVVTTVDGEPFTILPADA